jgi:hypothetical protein
MQQRLRLVDGEAPGGELVLDPGDERLRFRWAAGLDVIAVEVIAALRDCQEFRAWAVFIEPR